MSRLHSTQTGGEIDVRKYAISEPLKLIELYSDFCKKDIESAVAELEKIKDEANRVNLQKLVYLNLVNRFDTLIDNLLLWFALNNSEMRKEILKELEEEPIFKKEVYELFVMKDRAFDLVNEKIKGLASNNLLRSRHSAKIEKILIKALRWKDGDCYKSRVNSDGKIFSKRSRNKTLPNSIPGYADWLYSRRNSIVHGNGTTYEKRDYDFISRKFNVALPKNFRLQLTSITTASNFYKDLLSLIEQSLIVSLES